MNPKRATGPGAATGRGITAWQDRQATCCLAGYQMPCPPHAGHGYIDADSMVALCAAASVIVRCRL